MATRQKFEPTQTVLLAKIATLRDQNKSIGSLEFFRKIAPKSADNRERMQSHYPNLINSRFSTKRKGRELPYPQARHAIDIWFESGCTKDGITGALPELKGVYKNGKWGPPASSSSGPPWFMTTTHGSTHTGALKVGSLNGSDRDRVCNQLKAEFMPDGWKPVDIVDLWTKFKSNAADVQLRPDGNQKKNEKKIKRKLARAKKLTKKRIGTPTVSGEQPGHTPASLSPGGLLPLENMNNTKRRNDLIAHLAERQLTGQLTEREKANLNLHLQDRAAFASGSRPSGSTGRSPNRELNLNFFLNQAPSNGERQPVVQRQRENEGPSGSRPHPPRRQVETYRGRPIPPGLFR
jgi:hypothetical protein